jgi:hypothetical protein
MRLTEENPSFRIRREKRDIFKIKDLTFKMAVVYDGHHFERQKIRSKKGR